eukprot:UN08743
MFFNFRKLKNKDCFLLLQAFKKMKKLGSYFLQTLKAKKQGFYFCKL